MQILEIKVEIDVTNSIQMQAAQQFLAALGGNACPCAANKQQSTTEAPKEEKPKRKRRTKAEIEADKVAKAEGEIPKSEDTTEQDSNNTDGVVYKIADVRTKLSEKVNTHRDAVKAKLSELGAKNVSSMKEEDYPEFMEFLNGLS